MKNPPAQQHEHAIQSWVGPVFITTYLTFGLLCMVTPIKDEPIEEIKIDKDVLNYEQARALHNSGVEENVHKAIPIYKDLVARGYYEVLDILIEIYHYGIPGIIERNPDMTEHLFSMRTKADRVLKGTFAGYVPRFTDAIAKGGIVKALRFAEVKERIKHDVAPDPQNTHDSGVTASVATTIDRLRELTKITTENEEAIENVKKWVLQSKLDKKKMTNAMTVLDKIPLNTTALGSVGMTEAEILALLHDRINDDANKEVREVLIENIVEELADSVSEQGYLHCMQGRISRMLNALNVLDPEISIKPRWAIRQEMLNDASATKQRILHSVPQKLRSKIEIGTDVISDKFDADFRQFIRKKFEKLYVESGVLTEHDLNKELEEWIEHI